MTIAVAMAKMTELLLLDEPSTGLDATTSLELFKFCRVIADEAVPVVASPLQPSNEVFFLFDNLLLLSPKGDQIYFGSIERALPFFEEFGFVCPWTSNIADFLLEVQYSIHLRTDSFE